ncbi:hypothetical protein KTS45_13685 [Halomicroarcula limicola]|uniref:DUF7344 domain-containing protein n=1 Tax=Haloarcula limicola TaxID=1429915 RepID=A0A8J7YDK5_9EURY|nr:hypothetical protein [Halomicroarcula limicola]MBV0925251.1 hypothetical protein [Halomicroarcula limicola]
MGDLDRIYRALAARERRLALSCLHDHQTLTLADLTELVLERADGADITAVSEDRIRDTYFALYHTHVPILEESDLVRYDQADDLVAATERVRPALSSVCDNVEAILAAEIDG